MPDNPNAIHIDPALYKTLLEATKAFPWKIDWATMRFAYVGPQMDRIHPEDRAGGSRVVGVVLHGTVAGGVVPEADYRQGDSCLKVVADLLFVASILTISLRASAARIFADSFE